MKSIQEALDAMLPAFRPLGTQRSSLHQALGRHLAEDVVTRRDLPPFDNSAMDGYAVRVSDLAQDSTARALPIEGGSRAGGPPPPPLAAGTVMRIFTGAPLPRGADAVVPQEDVVVQAGTVVVTRPVSRGAWVRGQGSDSASGTTLLERGARLGPGELGLLAAQGLAAVTVHRRPRVAIVTTGDELRELDEAPGPGTIVNSNAYTLAAQVTEAGGEAVVLPNVPDELDATVDALGQALDCDVVVTCGGVSVGDFDWVKQAFARVGVEAGFWKVNIKPGKPVTFGHRGRVPVVGLPGNPMGAMVTFEVLVRPGLRQMLGDPRPFRLKHLVALEGPHRHEVGRVELARATVAMKEGRLWATPLALQGSGSLRSMVGVDALVVLDERRADFAHGALLPALLLRDGVGSAESPFR